MKLGLTPRTLQRAAARKRKRRAAAEMEAQALAVQIETEPRPVEIEVEMAVLTRRGMKARLVRGWRWLAGLFKRKREEKEHENQE